MSDNKARLKLSTEVPNNLDLSRPLTPRELLIVLAILLIALLGFISIDCYSSKCAKQWPTTEGKFVAADVKVYSTFPYIGTKADYHWSTVGQKTGDQLVPLCYSGFNVVTADYNYTVNRQKYVGHNIVKSGDFLLPPNLLVGPYQLGSNVLVYYNPSNPADSVLKPESTATSHQLSLLRSLASDPMAIVLICLSVLFISFRINIAQSLVRRIKSRL